MDDEKNELYTNVQELVEAVRAIQRDKLALLEQEHVELIALRKVTSKMSSQQKRILKWLWRETQKRESYWEENDVHDINLINEMNQLRTEFVHLDLKYPHGDSKKWQRMVDHYAALFYLESERGIRWDIVAMSVDRPTKSEKASISRSLRELITRGLVERSRVKWFDHYISLTTIGRAVSKLLTPF